MSGLKIFHVIKIIPSVLAITGPSHWDPFDDKSPLDPAVACHCHILPFTLFGNTLTPDIFTNMMFLFKHYKFLDNMLHCVFTVYL